MARYRKLKLCKYCGKELIKINRIYCSSWCRELSYSKYRTKKAKDNFLNLKKIRKCKCGNDLKFHRHLCDDCKLKPFEYTKCENKCLNCGGDIVARLHNKYTKKFCENKCAKLYYYKNKQKNVIL